MIRMTLVCDSCKKAYPNAVETDIGFITLAARKLLAQAQERDGWEDSLDYERSDLCPECAEKKRWSADLIALANLWRRDDA